MEIEMFRSTINEFSKGKKEELIKEYSTLVEKDTLKGLQLKNIEEIIEYIINNDFENILSAFRNIELEQSYKYSALFKVISKDTKDLLSVLSGNESQYIINDNDVVLYKSCDEPIIINFHRVGTKLQNNIAIRKERVQSALIKLHEVDDELFIEVSIDSIQSYYRNNEGTTFYIGVIDKIINWLNTKLLLVTQPVSLNFTINKIRKAEESDFIVYAQLMNTNNGAKATLDSASSTTIILPILGEIKELLENNKNLFSNANEGYSLLEEYITELENESDLPWVTLKNKDKGVLIKFLFESATSREYTLLNYYYHEKGREGMDYVTSKLLSEYNKPDLEEDSEHPEQ